MGLSEHRIGRIAHRRGGQAGGVRIDDYEQGIVGEQLRRFQQEGIETGLHFPNFPAGTPAIAWRVHDDTVVAPSPANLPLDELAAVVHDPVDGLVLQAGGLGVFLGPGHHALGRIHMEDLCAARCRRQGSAAGISEEIQHPHGPVGGGHLFPDKVPVGSLLRKHARMLEIHGFYLERQVILIADKPLFRQVVIRPPAAGRRADIPGIIVLPAGVCVGGSPDHLGVRADQQVFAPPLQPFPFRGVQHFKIFPQIRDPNHIFSISPLNKPGSRWWGCWGSAPWG